VPGGGIPRQLHLTYVHQLFVTPYAVGGTRPYQQARRLAAETWCLVRVISGAEGLVDERGQRLRRGQLWLGMHFDPIDVPYANEMPLWRRLVSFAHFAASSVIRLVRARTDVYFVSSPPLSVTLPVLVWAAIARRPFVLEVRDLWPKAPIELGILTNRVLIRMALAYERWLYRRAAGIVTVAPSLADHIVAVSGRDDVVTVPNAADLEMRSPSPPRAEVWLREARRNGLDEAAIGANDRVVIYVGTLSRVQGVAWLPGFARALSQRDPRVKLVIVGSGSSREQVLEELRRAGLLGRTSFVLGPVVKHEVGALLSASDVALALAPPEGASADSANKFFDYAAAGVPIVSTDTGRQRELLAEFGAGLTLGVDPEAAADTLLALLADPDRLAALGRGSAALGDAYSRDRAYVPLRHLVADVAATAGHSCRCR
jgi:glycosyltransferase involved in cell wall biosynthesis